MEINGGAAPERDDVLGCVCKCGVRARAGLADYDEFFTNMRPQLVGLGFALTGNLQVASDLAQEALLRSSVHWEKIRTYQDPSAWARRVLRNLAANHARHLRRAPRPTLIEDDP